MAAMEETFRIDVDRIRKGDENAFEKVFHAYFERICCFAREYVCDWEVARELAQEAFIRLWEIRDNLDDGSDIPALLFTITRNNALNYMKHLTVRQKYSDYTKQQHLESQLNLIALSDLQVDILFRNDMQKAIHQAVDELPDRCKEVFIMSRHLGMSYKEIAQKLKISGKTVENHISEALKRLRLKIKQNM
ncbi:MAG: RNA polymerase sigma-70 factor [Bacteroidales bacterium]|nr:RNA polymerase sigma-70 factor [Bacteroidales bacterium]